MNLFRCLGQDICAWCYLYLKRIIKIVGDCPWFGRHCGLRMNLPMVWSWVRIGVKGWRRGRKEAGTGLSTIFYSKMRSKNLSLYFYFLRKLFGERPLKVAFLYRSGCRIGSFLEILCLLFSSKSSPKIKWLFGLFPKTIIFNKNRYFLGDFSNNLLLYITLRSHRCIDSFFSHSVLWAGHCLCGFRTEGVPLSSLSAQNLKKWLDFHDCRLSYGPIMMARNLPTKISRFQTTFRLGLKI